MGSGIGAFYNDGRKLQKHEVARKKLDKRDRKLLRMAARVEARKAAKEYAGTSPKGG